MHCFSLCSFCLYRSSPHIMLLDEPTPGNLKIWLRLLRICMKWRQFFPQGGNVIFHVVNTQTCIRAVRNHLDLETIEGLAMALNKFEARTKAGSFGGSEDPFPELLKISPIHQNSPWIGELGTRVVWCW